MTEEPIVGGSALKHGAKVQDILHAYRNPIRIGDLGDGFTMTVGATATASILEVGYIQGETAVVIVPACEPGRSSYGDSYAANS